jgi:hypothetical protein
VCSDAPTIYLLLSNASASMLLRCALEHLTDLQYSRQRNTRISLSPSY